MGNKVFSYMIKAIIRNKFSLFSWLISRGLQTCKNISEKSDFVKRMFFLNLHDHDAVQSQHTEWIILYSPYDNRNISIYSILRFFLNISIFGQKTHFWHDWVTAYFLFALAMLHQMAIHILCMILTIYLEQACMNVKK